jgi:hypothetical protein
MNLPASAQPDGKDRTLILLCIAAIVIGATPIALSCAPLPTFDFFRANPGLRAVGQILLLATVTFGIYLVAQWDSDKGPAKIARYVGFALLAAVLTDVHYFTVDNGHMRWQIEQYGQILAHNCHPPDQYRFLPQGTLWWLTLGNGDFVASCLAYRFFFTFLVCLSIYKFARLFLNSRDAILVVFAYAAFYPLSTRYYFGNLLDPMSHAVMIAGLRYCWLQKFWCFFWLLVLGVCIKETMLLLVPCYLLMNPGKNSWRNWHQLKCVGLLAIAGICVFLACRLPFDFNASFQSLNRTPEIMLYANLGLAPAQIGSIVSVFQRYLHPVLFIFMWLPLILWRRRWLPAPLFWSSIYFSLAMYLVNLFFGWNYESRNFIPALIVLVVCTVIIVNRFLEQDKPSSTRPQAAE